MGHAFITRRGGGGYSKKATGYAPSINNIVTVSGLGFTPKVVCVYLWFGYNEMSNRMKLGYKDEETLIVYAGDNTDVSSNATYAINLTDDGFTWNVGFSTNVYSNTPNRFFWIALG